MGIKRFDYVQDAERRDSWMEECYGGKYALSSDYDALAANYKFSVAAHDEATQQVIALAAELAAERESGLRCFQDKVKLEAALRGMIAVADGEAGNTPWRNIDAARAALEKPVSVSTTGTVRVGSVRDMLVPRSAKKKKSAGRQKCNCSIPKGFRHASWCASEVGLVPEMLTYGKVVDGGAVIHNQSVSETDVCQYCGKELPDGCRTEFQGESACEGYSVPTPKTEVNAQGHAVGCTCRRCVSLPDDDDQETETEHE